VVLAVLFLANAVIGYALVWAEHRGVLTVAFLDIGQGDAIFIESPRGAQLLIDGGPDRAVLRALGGVMPMYDRSIDVALATHPDADHIGGLPDVLNAFKVGAVIENGSASETATFRAFERASDSEPGAKHILATRGMRIALDEVTTLTILFPDRDISTAESNDGSIVARLDYGTTSFLFTGDSPQSVEKYLVFLDSASLDVDVLKAGHHGSKTSTSPEFLAATSPDYAIISAGKDNKYGHPHQQVLDALTKANIETLRTDEVGTIVFESDGTRLWRR
jgi:competence protein ComEC